MPKKCPACNSTRYQKIDNDFRCARCGFINKSRENLEKQIINFSNSDSNFNPNPQ